MAHRIRRGHVAEASGNGDDVRRVLRRRSTDPNASSITGVVCGVRVEDIDDPLMQQIRYLDKLVDELAKGKPLGKVLRA
jgi:hypothetical protein